MRWSIIYKEFQRHMILFPRRAMVQRRRSDPKLPPWLLYDKVHHPYRHDAFEYNKCKQYLLVDITFLQRSDIEHNHTCKYLLKNLLSNDFLSLSLVSFHCEKPRFTFYAYLLECKNTKTKFPLSSYQGSVTLFMHPHRFTSKFVSTSARDSSPFLKSCNRFQWK